MTTLVGKLTLWWLNRRANAALIFKRREQAIEAYREMIAVDPSYDFARLMLGNLLAEAGDAAGAVSELERLVQRSPKHADGWFNLGFLHDKADNLAEAERCFGRAVQLKPTLDRAWYGLGLVLIREGRLEEAVEALKQNVKVQPFNPYGYYQLGMTYHHLGRSDEAWKVHKQLSGFEPKFSATLKRDLEQTPSRAQPIPVPTVPPKEESAAEAT
jgi:tetratricopeptide (TPR) repeat protein